MPGLGLIFDRDKVRTGPRRMLCIQILYVHIWFSKYFLYFSKQWSQCWCMNLWICDVIRVYFAAARIWEILECTGLSQENLSQSGVTSANTLFQIHEDELELLIGKVTETPLYTPTTILSFGEHQHRPLIHTSTLIQLHQIMTLTWYLPNTGLQFESVVAIVYNCQT